MNRSIKTMIISLLLILSSPMAKLSAQVSVWDGTWQPWTHGTGTASDPFLIENAQQLAYLAYRVNNGLDANGGHVSNHDYHYKLMVDVDLNGSESLQWTPIGYWNSDTDYQCFGGYFEGNNHTISGLYINSSANRVGFCGYTNGATIQHVSVTGNAIATTGQYAGGIIGVADGTSVITNCYNTGTVSSSSSSYPYYGGIVGYAAGNANVTNCYNTGTISSSSGYAAGIVGYAAGNANIINCYNTGTVSSSIGYASHSGGIVGCAATANITNCYNTGTVSSYGYSGGIVGRNNNGTVINSYYLNTCGGNNTYGGQPMSADAMKSEEFVSILNNGSNTWIKDAYNVNYGYPIFSGVLYTNVITTGASSITQTHAILNGTAYSTTNHILCGFEYKKASDSHYQTVNVSGSGNISTTISGLQPNTEYLYRVFCTLNNSSTYYGEEQTFTTKNITIRTHEATNLTETSATLNGYIDAGDATVSGKGFR